MSQVETTSELIQEAFTEWDRRYREDPDKFMNEAKRLLTEDAETYGESAAPYFLKLLDEIRVDRDSESPAPPQTD